MKIGTLFSGVGAPEQGAKRVYDDLDLIFACEFDKYARESFNANYEIAAEHFHEDINDMDGTQYKDKVDIIIGGSPCQDFSIAGLRAGIDGHRGQLIWQYYRIIMEAQPPIFIYENVKGMVSDKDGKTISDFLEIFRQAGYHCHYDVLNTKNYGVPQNRERVFIVGFRDVDLYHSFHFAPEIILEKQLKDVLEDEVDEKYYLSDEQVEGFTKHDKQDRLNLEYKSQANTIHSTEKPMATLCAGTHGYAQGYIKVNSATVKGYEEATTGDSINLTFPESKTRRGRVGKQVAQTLDCACNQAVVIAAIRGRNPSADEPIQQMLEINESGTSNCLTTVQKDNMVVETDRIRKLTPRECLRLQDFPDSFKQIVSNSQMYKQAGNSMSVNITEMILIQIEKAKAGEKPMHTLF